MNKNKNQIKLSILALVILVSYVLPLPGNITFAADAFFSSALLDMLSRIWIVPAKFAGIFMNNSMIYGSAINMDVYLWKMWNIMKNFANYTLGFAFIFIILKTFFAGEPNSVIKSNIPRMLVAGVLIQMSWFLLGALIDVSNIMTAAIASLPARMDTMKNFKEQMKGNEYFKIPNKITVKEDGKIEHAKESLSAEQKDKMLSMSYNNIGGPLVFLGYGIMKFQEYSFSGNNTTDKNLAIGTMIKVMLMFMFVLPLILLLVVNIIRMVYIWVWIVFSPFIVLFNFMGKEKSMLKKLPDKGLFSKESMEFSNVIGLIFQPVAVVGSLVLAIFFISGLAVSFTSMSSSSGDGVKKMLMIQENSGGGGTMGDPQIFSYTFDSKFLNGLGDILGGALGYLILAIFTIMLLWSVLKVGFSASKITKGFTDKAFNFAKSMAMAAPIVPGGLSLGAMGRATTQMQGIPQSIIGNQSGKIEDKMRGMFGIEGINSSEMNKLKNDIRMASSPTDKGKTLISGIKNLLSKSSVPLSENSSLKSLIYESVNENRGYFEAKVGKLNDFSNFDELLSKNPEFRRFLNTALAKNIDYGAGDKSWQSNQEVRDYISLKQK